MLILFIHLIAQISVLIVLDTLKHLRSMLIYTTFYHWCKYLLFYYGFVVSLHGIPDGMRAILFILSVLPVIGLANIFFHDDCFIDRAFVLCRNNYI